MFKNKGFKLILIMLSLVLVTNMLLPLKANADAVAGDVIVTLGEDLTESQKETVLKKLGIENENDVEIVYVTNKEEHNYLGDYIPKAQIGTKAISSAKITIGEKDTGLMVETNNINYITGEMYTNALATAGVSDAEIHVTAPFEVSGTGALTGIFKAYEVTSGEKIDEDMKKAANEEMVLTAELSEDENIGEEKAVDFMNQIKTEIAEQNPQTKAELRDLIQQLANELGISLTENQLNQLVDLFNKLKDLNIDWDKVNQTLETAKQKFNEFAESEEGQNIINSFLDLLRSIWDAIVSIFSK